MLLTKCTWLVATLWVTTAVSSSVDSEFDVSARGLAKRASNACPTNNVTTPLGQIYSTSVGPGGCLKNSPGNDIANISDSSINDISDCMSYCAFQGDGLAYGAVFDFGQNPGTCYCKDEGILNSTAVSDITGHTAIVVNNNEDPNLSCPFNNGSSIASIQGASYQIHCGTNMPFVDDMCPWTSPTYAEAVNDICPTHANGLKDCMNQCAAAHPLCLAVVYSPSMTTGYGNCYFKSNVSAANYRVYDSSTQPYHLAVFNPDQWNLNGSCTNETTYTSPNGALFDIACDQNRAFNDLSQIHTQNLSACADACATYSNSSTQPCVGVIFDSTMGSGYENCWLKDSTGVPGNVQGVHWAELTQAPSTGGPNAAPPPSPSKSKAWIAGPVIGAIVAVAALAGLLYWLRRRRQQRAAPAHPAGSTAPPSYRDDKSRGTSYAPSLANHGQPQGGYVPYKSDPNAAPGTYTYDAAKFQHPPEIDGTPAAVQLDGTPVVHELPGGHTEPAE